MEAIVSIVSLMVIATVTVILLYQNARVRDNVVSNMQSMVDQINDSTYYGYEYDKKQENNIKNLDQNIKTLASDVGNVASTLKNMKLENVTNSEMFEKVKTKNVETGILHLGDKFSLSGVGDSFGNDDWLRLLNAKGDTPYGGIAAGKFYSQQGSTFNGMNYGDSFTLNNMLKVKGGNSEFNPQNMETIFNNTDNQNYIRGDTELRGNVKTIGDMSVGRNLNVHNSINIERSDYGPLFNNKNSRGSEMGMGQYVGDELRFYNYGDMGSMSFGFGVGGSNFAPALELKKNSTTFGSGDGRFTFDTSSDIRMKANNDNKKFIFQNGAKPPVVIKKGNVGIGGEPIDNVGLDVYGNIASRGNTLHLGVSGNLLGDSKMSRALVKGQNGDLILNYEGDFQQGITTHSDFGVIGGKCIETGKAVSGKEANAGKICYKSWSDGLDVVGAGSSGTERKVKVWDNLETGKVQASKLCLDDVCVNRNDMFKMSRADGNICVGNTCLTEEELIKLRSKLL